MAASTVPPQHQVFINFRGADLRQGFVSHLLAAMKRDNINVFIDELADRGELLDSLLTRIEGSSVAVAIFSKKYTDSKWCMKEAVKMYECMKEGNLVVIPVFYKVKPSDLRDLEGDFSKKLWVLVKGDEKKKKQFDEALKSFPNAFGITVDETSFEAQIISEIVKAVIKALYVISQKGSQNVSADPSETSDAGTVSAGENDNIFGIDARLKELGDKLDCDKYKETRIIGVVGMPGIGKTTLIKELFKEWQSKFNGKAFINQIRVQAKEFGCDYLPTLLLEQLLGLEHTHTANVADPYETYKDQLLGCKVLVFLDDVSNTKQIDALLGKRDWIKKGSRIVIATSDMSLTTDLVDDTYMVRHLNHEDSLKLFRYHAFRDDQANRHKEDFAKFSEVFAHFARGHPVALKMLGVELNNQRMDLWKSKLKKLTESQIPNIKSVFQVSYDEMSQEEKDAFLEIACFRSENVEYVESLLASSGVESAGTTSAVKALKNKFLINTCDGRVEMHDLLFKFSREIDIRVSTQDCNIQQRSLWLHQDITKKGLINVLQNKMTSDSVRGIFLDLSEVKGEMCLHSSHFRYMRNLRYLKFYNSHCPQECETKNKINIPDGLNLPLKEIRCLHWLKFPLEELPNDFNPINLVDLKLSYSDIQRLWEGNKDTSSLKWVDLSHSSKLCSLSGLSMAKNLQRLNLEGCTALKTLPPGMRDMIRLAFLNLKGCTSLESLPEMSLTFLKTLTLSGCSNFKDFPLISANIEILYLDGTAISELPTNMEKLQRLVVLNMKNCKRLEKITDRVGELKALQELILSDCLNLKYFPEVKMSSLHILLLDGTAIEVMPQLSSVQYLCLSRNDKITCLPAGICKLFQLKWLDLKYCTSLASVPELPPNLQCLDAHGCSSLKTVSKPLARIMPTEQNHSTFIFTNCKNLEQAAKEEISSYAQRKCHLLSYARTRYNGGLVSDALFSTSFPGCEVPSWFCYETVGSELEVKLLPHWHDKRLAGIALCAVVSFGDCHDQISRLSVTCNFKVKVEDKSWIPFTCPVGSWTRQGDKIESEHVFIGYTSCPYTKKCPEEENSDKCSSTDASLEFTVAGGTNEKGEFTVLKCGLGLVYAKDKSKNSSHEAKYDMPVEKRVGGDGRPKNNQKSRMDNNDIPCQSNRDASVTPIKRYTSGVRHTVEKGTNDIGESNRSLNPLHLQSKQQFKSKKGYRR